MFQKLLIANRGEIAVRIIRACHEMGILTVAVFSEPDREALHVKMADEAVCIGSAAAKDSYLNMDRILNAALITNAQAIHPGFGFLSENDQFAEKCQDWGVVFVGPSSELIRKMGNKSVAKETMRQAGIPVIEGSKEPVFDNKEALRQAEKIGFPVMVKAAFGGGGKGMRIVSEKSEFESLFRLAQQEAVRSFGDSTMYLEKYIQNPRHVEVQIVADSFGNVICLGERDCSVQRRHQKMIEESPCTGDEYKNPGGTSSLRGGDRCRFDKRTDSSSFWPSIVEKTGRGLRERTCDRMPDKRRGPSAEFFSVPGKGRVFAYSWWKRSEGGYGHGERKRNFTLL